MILDLILISALSHYTGDSALHDSVSIVAVEDRMSDEKNTRHINLNLIDIFEVSEEDAFTKEEVLRYPASFADPGRLALFSSSVFSPDDQANHVSVRGCHPYQNKWFLEGVEVLNPNHLENAGTFSDKPGASGGGVNLFSTLVMERSRFMKGVLPASLNNVTGGAFDVSLREGTSDSIRHVLQASLLGLETMSEGPIANKFSYLAHFRYSTVGLLSMAGVNFGNEKINYFDGSAVVGYRSGITRAKLFFIAGRSSNLHEPVDDSLEISTFKDFQKIRYDSRTVISGADFTRRITLNTDLSVTAAYSYKLNERSESGLYNSPTHDKEQKDLYSWKVSGRTFRNRFVFKYGITGNHYDHKHLAFPFVSAENSYGRITLVGGLSSSFGSANHVNPRAGISFKANHRNIFSFKAGTRTQVFMPSVFESRPELLRSKDAEFTYQFILRQGTFRATGFRQTVLNGKTESSLFYLNSSGVELTTEYTFGSFNILFTASVFEVSDAGSTIENELFDYGFGGNFYIGKQFTLNTKRTLTLDLRTHYHAGGYQQVIDGSASHFSGTTVFLTEIYRLPSYFRTDLRVSLITKSRKTGILFLDIQNVSDKKNISANFFDPYQNRVIQKEQLGIIPVLGYRIDL